VSCGTVIARSGTIPTVVGTRSGKYRPAGTIRRETVFAIL
jgi:hypothetical protein